MRPDIVIVCLAALLASAPLGAQPVSDSARATLSRSLGPKEVTPVIEKSIERGLRFLANAQQKDGSFGKGSWEDARWQTYPTAMTALVGLTFLASGSTPTRGPYAANVQRVTDYLLGHATGKHSVAGLFSNPTADEARPMYCHAFTMTYLALIFGQETDPRRREQVRGALQRAIELTGKTQTRYGGWGYWPNDNDDEGTLVVTFLQGLRACRDAGIYVPKRIIDNAVQYIKDSTNRDGSVRYRVRASTSNTRPGVTCASVVALWQAGEYESDELKRISDHVSRYIEPTWAYDWRRGHHAEYVQYYLAQSQFVLGGARWESYYQKISTVLAGEQSAADGSWEGKDRGDIYGSAIALLILQLPYNRLSVFQR